MHKRLAIAGILALAASSAALTPVQAKPGTISPAGMRGGFHSTRLIEVADGKFYTVENGTLFSTSPNGSYRQLGVKNDYHGTIDMISAYGELYLTKDDRTLYRVLPDGRRKMLGDPGVTNIRYMSVLNGELYGIENDGTLYRISKEGVLTQVGPPGGWEKVQTLFTFKGQLWTMDHGTLYRANEAVKWRQVGGVGAFKWSDFLIPGNNRIWMVANGDFFSVDGNGKKTVIGRRRWKNVSAMTTYNGKLYAFENSGRMFITSTR